MNQLENELKKLQKHLIQATLGAKISLKQMYTKLFSISANAQIFPKKISNTNEISKRKSKELSDEVIKPPATSDNGIAPELRDYGTKTRVKFDGSCLKQDKIKFSHEKIVNIYIAYELGSTLNSFDPTLEKCLFGTVKLTKNADIDKYKYSGYGIRFDSKAIVMFLNGEFACDIIMSVADISSSVHVDNKKNKILLLLTRPYARITWYNIKLQTKNIGSTLQSLERNCLSFHYSGESSQLFINGTEIHKFKSKDSEIVATPLCLENIIKDFSEDNMKKNGLYGYVYDFGVNYDAIDV